MATLKGIVVDKAESSRTSRPLISTGTALAMALAGTVWLWAYYGAIVFFETIRAGYVACFG